MPTYEYACTSCAHEWELEQSIKADPATDCPKCKAPTARRQISRGTGFILKGGGWYSDLYSSASNKGSATSSPSGGETSGASISSSAGSAGADKAAAADKPASPSKPDTAPAAA